MRHSYRRTLCFPGGGVKRGEAPEAAARREVAEEIGLELAAGDLTLSHETVADWDFRRDHVRIFELRLDAEPALALDRREIVAARFLTPRAALRCDLPPFVRDYLRKCAAKPADAA